MKAPLFARSGLLALSAAVLLVLPQRASATLTFDLRVTGGGKLAYVSQVGQVISLDIYAQVTGAAGDARPEGFQDAYGSVLSTANGNIMGSISSSLVSTFTANGYQLGKQQSLDGDTDLDLGSNATSHNTDFFFARASGMQTAGDSIPNGTEFKLGTFSFTVQNVGSFSLASSPIAISFKAPVFNKGIDIEALWTQDGSATTSKQMATLVGSDVMLQAVPEPSSVALLGLAGLALAARRRARRCA